MGMALQAMLLGPSLKALAMVLKALLQQLGLNERVSGGLGSYCLLNLIIAHLMAQAGPEVALTAAAVLSENPPCKTLAGVCTGYTASGDIGCDMYMSARSAWCRV